ncbi:MAG: cytochrome P450 [Deltaproteobacteria bacterium]|nr:MAG: cytochrome P450 [Deltaproteobacteria bacterium]
MGAGGRRVAAAPDDCPVADAAGRADRSRDRRRADPRGRPERFDVHRNARGHVAFIYGPHQCLGQTLARLELEVVFRRLFARFPTLALAVSRDEVPVRPANVGLFGV